METNKEGAGKEKSRGREWRIKARVSSSVKQSLLKKTPLVNKLYIAAVKYIKAKALSAQAWWVYRGMTHKNTPLNWEWSVDRAMRGQILQLMLTDRGGECDSVGLCQCEIHWLQYHLAAPLSHWRVTSSHLNPVFIYLFPWKNIGHVFTDHTFLMGWPLKFKRLQSPPTRRSAADAEIMMWLEISSQKNLCYYTRGDKRMKNCRTPALCWTRCALTD